MDKLMNHQFNIFNDKVSVIATIPIEDKEYATNFAKRCLMDFYKKPEEDLQDLKCELLCSFFSESLINLEYLKSEEMEL